MWKRWIARASKIALALIASIPAVTWMTSDPGDYWRPVFILFSGNVFSPRPIVTGGALDQPSLTKGYFIFCLFSLAAAIMLLAWRWVADRRNPWACRALLALCLLMFLEPMCVLAITFYDLTRYIRAMGSTPARVEGIVFGLGAFLAVPVFIAWASGYLGQWRSQRRNAGAGFPILARHHRDTSDCAT